MIEVPAIIQKSDIVPVGLLKDKVNRVGIVIKGIEYPTRTLVFEGFAGALDLADGMYKGMYRFSPVEGGKDYKYISFLVDLPGFGKPLPVVQKESELIESEEDE